MRIVSCKKDTWRNWETNTLHCVTWIWQCYLNKIHIILEYSTKINRNYENIAVFSSFFNALEGSGNWWWLDDEDDDNRHDILIFIKKIFTQFITQYIFSPSLVLHKCPLENPFHKIPLNKSPYIKLSYINVPYIKNH